MIHLSIFNEVTDTNIDPKFLWTLKLSCNGFFKHKNRNLGIFQ